MKRTIIFSTLIAILTFTGISIAQSSPVRVTFSEAINPDSTHSVAISFTGPENPNMRLFEAVIPFTSEAGCFETTHFTDIRPIGPERASIAYDSVARKYKLKWNTPEENGESCRVLIGNGAVDAHDFIAWRRAGPSSSLADFVLDKDEESSTEPMGGGSLGTIRYSYAMSFNPGN